MSEQTYEEMYPFDPNGDYCPTAFWSPHEDPEVDRPWLCTRHTGHEGPHVGHDLFGNVVAIEGVL